MKPAAAALIDPPVMAMVRSSWSPSASDAATVNANIAAVKAELEARGIDVNDEDGAATTSDDDYLPNDGLTEEELDEFDVPDGTDSESGTAMDTSEDAVYAAPDDDDAVDEDEFV